MRRLAFLSLVLLASGWPAASQAPSPLAEIERGQWQLREQVRLQAVEALGVARTHVIALLQAMTTGGP